MAPADPSGKPVPNRLKELRGAAGLSQAALAERVGTTKAQISKLETGAQELRHDWMRRLAPALGVRPADLLPADDAPGLAESDARYEPPPQGDRLLAALWPGRPGAFWIQARSDALNLSGILPGDYMICEQVAAPAAGDLVVVNLVRPDGRVETLLRVHDPQPARGPAPSRHSGMAVLRPNSANPRHDAVLWDPSDPDVAVMGRIVCRFGAFAERTDRAPGNPHRLGKAAA